MNYDLMTWIEYFMGAFACCFGLFFSGTIITNKKIMNLKFYHYLILIPFSGLIVLNTLILNNVAKMLGMLLILFSLFKITYRFNNEYTMVVSSFTYIMCIIAEITFSLIAISIDYLFDVNFISKSILSISGNVIIAILSCVYAFSFRNKFNYLIEKINQKSVLFIFFFMVITILIVFSSMYNLYLNNWKIDYNFVLNLLIIFGGLILLFVFFKQQIKKREITDKYNLLEDYMKTSAELIEKYSSTNHKYKNNLIAIKGYVNSDVEKAKEYIDNLLEYYENKKYNWFSKINYIKIDVIRYLVYYKLSKAEDMNLKITVDVSNVLKKIRKSSINSNELNILLEILGEYFDNAIYASNESKEKEINFVLYLENDRLIFVLANTYKGKIDLSLITKNGYTTKGKGHGFGLYDIEKSINNHLCFNSKYELIDKYFVMTFEIITNFIA